MVRALHAAGLEVILGGVVEDDVEDHLEPGGVQRADHLLELADLLPAVARRVLVVRGEISDRLVTPVVAQPARDQRGVVDELVDGQQLDGRDAELGQVIDDGGMRPARDTSPQLLGHVGMQLREPLDVELVDDRVLERRARGSVAAPVELVRAHHRSRHVRRRVVGVLAGHRRMPVARCRRSRARRDRAAAWRDCSGRRGRDPMGRAREIRSASRPGGRRRVPATRIRCRLRAAGGPRCRRRRTGTPRRPRRRSRTRAKSVPSASACAPSGATVIRPPPARGRATAG